MPKKILVVDDEKDFLNITKKILLREGFQVMTALNGKEALGKLRDQSPDLIILDINMPVMDGYDTCKEIRKDPLYKDMPVIMLTINSGLEDKLEGLKTGSDEYLTKPFNSEELLLRIRKILK